MKPTIHLLASLCWMASALVNSQSPYLHARANSAASKDPTRISEQYGKLPLYFEPNQGQTDSPVNEPGMLLDCANVK